MSRRPDWTIRPLLDPASIPLDERVSPFQAPWSATLELLARELEYLRADHVVLELEITEAQLRRDGGIRADARPASPRVRLSFDSRHGPLTYATARFGNDTLDLGWKWNVRAIALGLEALRRVDRYGITRRGEQYTGWLQIESGEATATRGVTVEAAADAVLTLAGVSGGTTASQVIADADTYRRAYRSAARRTHPDHGGDPARWHQLQRAREVLDTHHGIGS